MDRYVVIGHPVSHSLSPAIHARFAAQVGDPIEYTTLEAPLDDFAGTARAFFAAGGRGANVTLPFKVDAYRFAAQASARAQAAGAANFLAVRGARIECDNTDGLGLVADLTRNIGLALRGARILMIGAGGAARGVIGPLLEEGPAQIVIANRTPERAHELARRFDSGARVAAAALDAIPAGRYDLAVNATSTSTHGEALALPEPTWKAIAFAYDMAYGEAARPFLARARAEGAAASDGLGMLVEQAAESFALWRGARPLTAPVLAELRAARR